MHPPTLGAHNGTGLSTFAQRYTRRANRLSYRARVAPRDLSAGGIGFLHRGSLPGGTPVAVHFPLGEGRMLSATGRVVRYFGLTKDVYDVGVTFDKPLDLQIIMGKP
jgi:hypothetical protein